MRVRRAQRMLEKAREYVGDELPTAPHFDDVNLKRFLRLYLWVIYVSNSARWHPPSWLPSV